MSDQGNTDLEAQLAAFADRCNKDVNFTKNAVAAVLANDELKLAFHYELSNQGQTVSLEAVPKDSCSMKFSYRPGVINYDKPLVSFSKSKTPPNTGSQQPMQPQTQQLTLIGTDGENIVGLLPAAWAGLMTVAAEIMKLVPLGIVITALVQTLFGTRLGPILLIVLLAL
jgi:hypothetical protein